MDAVYRDFSLLTKTVTDWFSEFQRGCPSALPGRQPGATKTATMEDNLTIIHDLVIADWRLMVREIVETLFISNPGSYILHAILGMGKKLERCVLRLIPLGSKRFSETITKECLILFKPSSKGVPRRFKPNLETGIQYTQQRSRTSQTSVLYWRTCCKEVKEYPTSRKCYWTKLLGM